MEKEFRKRMTKDYIYLFLAIIVVLIGIALINSFTGYGKAIEESERTKLHKDALEKVDPENRGFKNY